MSTATLKAPASVGVDPDRVLLSPMDSRIEPRLITRSRVLSALGIFAVAAALTYTQFAAGLGRVSTASAGRLAVAEVRYGAFQENIPLTGTVVPRTTVYLDTVDGGQVAAVHAEAGEIVSAGEPLVTLKNTNLHLQVIAAETQHAEQLNMLSQTRLIADEARYRNQLELIELELTVDRLGRELDRRSPLAASGGVTKSEIEDLAHELEFRNKALAALLEARRVNEEFRFTQLAQMSASLDATDRSLAIARENLENLVITAPFSGQLSSLEARVGESKAPGQRIGQIDEPNAFKVSALVDEFYLQRVMLNQTAQLDIDRRRHELQVVKVYPGVRNRQFEVDLEFVGRPPELVRKGQTVQMQLQIGQPADTLILDNGAFFDDTGGQWVFVLHDSGNYAERRPVQFGRRTIQSIEVLEGLSIGQTVITSSYEGFHNVDRIELGSGS